MIKPIHLRVSYGSINGSKHNKIVAEGTPVLSWGGFSDADNDFQTAYHVIVTCEDQIWWDSGEVQSACSQVRYPGSPLPAGKRAEFALRIAGNDGRFSDWVKDSFYCGGFEQLPPAQWICCSRDKENVPVYFRKHFTLDGSIKEAAVFVSGIGYSQVMINGKPLDNTMLNPAISDYTKTCYYMVIPEIQDTLMPGNNRIDIILADGWRRNNGDYLNIYKNKPGFFGTPCLWAALRITYADNREQWLLSDNSWQWYRGPILESNLFNGETYDASVALPGGDISCPENNSQVTLFNGQLGILRPMTVEPIGVYEEISPVSIWRTGIDKYTIDFGKNMAGILCIKLPTGMNKGHKVILRHSELLYDDGTLNCENLRGALNQDVYIASGDEKDLEYYQPTFTYHGFRYAEVTGIPLLDKTDVTALMICTQLESHSTFSCGNPLLKKVTEIIRQTEASTIHSLINDTCGRSERLCWINDGFVRYEELAYHFDIGKLYPQVMQAVLDTQESDGSVTCTAPHVYGRRPGDPLTSAYLFLAKEAYLRTGNLDMIRDNYSSFAAWTDLLFAHSTDYIMDYSYYGDWCCPKYACDTNTMGGGAGSKLTPPLLFATVILLATCRTMEEFAGILEKTEDRHKYKERIEQIKEAFLKKWYIPGSGRVHNGDHTCQTLALYYDILPVADRQKAAKLLRDNLVENDYRFTTGSISFKLMTEVLIRYGYLEEFYELVTRDSYPSLGYMLQCGATTGWEKYEYITGSGMNTHTHCANGGVCSTYYKYLVGITPVGAGYSEVDIKPYYPKKLHTAALTLQTIRGEITVSWRKIQGKTTLCVNIPFNTKANIHTPDGIKTVGSGFHSYVWED